MTGEGCTIELKEMSIWGTPGSCWTMLSCESSVERHCGVGALHPSPLTPSLRKHHETPKKLQGIVNIITDTKQEGNTEDF